MSYAWAGVRRMQMRICVGLKLMTPNIQAISCVLALKALKVYGEWRCVFIERIKKCKFLTYLFIADNETEKKKPNLEVTTANIETSLVK